MANKILSFVLHTFTIALLVVVLLTLKETIKSQKEEITKISVIEEKLKGLDIECVAPAQ